MNQFKAFLALEASAGSGKTFALSIRFITLLLQGARINEILAITFTKKAANEMQKRIIETFLHLEKEEKNAECKELCKLLNTDKNHLLQLRDKRKREFLQSELRIYTFDAFFSKILRSFALNLGLSSDFVLCDKLDVFTTFIKLLGSDELKDLALYMFQTDENKKDFHTMLDTLYKNAFMQEYPKAQCPNKENIYKTYQALKTYALSLNDKKINSFFKEKDFDLNIFLKSSFFKEDNYISKLQDSVFRDKKEDFVNALQYYANEFETYQTANLMKWLHYFIKAKNFIHSQKNTLTFSDVSRRVFDLIMSKDKEMIYFRLDGKISHLLIDEFQDTNVIQYHILLPIIEELVSGIGVKEKRSFFYVGDKKQSIYRFRNGKKELFDDLQKRFSQIQKESLDTNYRSSEVLVDFINDTFKGKYSHYIAQKIPKDESKKGGFVRIVSSQENTQKEIKTKTLEALLQELIFLQSKNIKLDTICILCWKNDDADFILDFLKEQKIPAFTESNVLLERKASVKAVLEYAKFCIFGDEFYSYFLKELLGKEFPRLQLDLCKNPAQVVLYLIEKLSLDLNDVALVQFVEYAFNKVNFLQLLFEPCPLKIVSEQNMGISIMTVHKSKGLEFENVILLDSLSRSDRNTQKILFEFDTVKGWELKMRSLIRKTLKEPSYMKFLEKRQEADDDEDLNKLYVAFTRAKNALIVIKRNEKSVNGNNPSYFCQKNGTFLFLQEQDRGFLDTQKHEVIKKVREESVLEPFEKIPKQEVQSVELSHSKEKYFGEAFHFFMQRLDLNEGKNFSSLCEKTKDKFRYFLSKEDFSELFQSVQRLYYDENFRVLINGKQLFKEQNLSFQGEIKRLDLLALSEDEAYILDYKTGISMKDKDEEQVRVYKNAVNAILQKKITKAFLFYCLKNEICVCEV
ncbi:RecB-like helicase [Campylobacter sp. MIT 21-1685]|uniref:RecB-like helicase n=1 Tax=unclassified Campylobacter TaxID=2593542 RepID=UPI00224A4FC4|nr:MULTISPECIES: RecB-like helicase [unclassified Campylobacter]MCX2683575.1 RecB-like helicase [Campylobacter sp. MIT 21-1684]MCX2751830.1 RecB-like helicase [Campylobacter sp. MIT 21-1682]MCX2808059.1 RecB-like helicase [Campylobacter sp. MIT 21-1685]